MVEHRIELQGDRTRAEASGLKHALTVASGAAGAAMIAAFSSHLALSTISSLSPTMTESITFIASAIALVAMLAYELVVHGKNA